MSLFELPIEREPQLIEVAENDFDDEGDDDD